MPAICRETVVRLYNQTRKRSSTIYIRLPGPQSFVSLYVRENSSLDLHSSSGGSILLQYYMPSSQSTASSQLSKSFLVANIFQPRCVCRIKSETSNTYIHSSYNISYPLLLLHTSTTLDWNQPEEGPGRYRTYHSGRSLSLQQ